MSALNCSISKGYGLNTIRTAIFFMLIAMVCGTALAQDVKSYDIHRTTGTITIDGKLDESDWNNAVEATLTETNTGDPVPLKSTVKLLWDDNYLYVGFFCEDPDAWATIEEFDGPLWGEEVVEVFIDPEGKGHTYYELEVSPINNLVDLFVINQGKEHQGRIKIWLDWSYKDMKREVQVVGDGMNEGTDDTSWTTELALPFDEMWLAENIPPKEGDMWRMNCYRIERGASGTTDDDWYAAFNPTKRGSFHTSWEFGKFYFKN